MVVVRSSLLGFLTLAVSCIASAQCYQFASGTAANLTVTITDPPAPTVLSDAAGGTVSEWSSASGFNAAVSLTIGQTSYPAVPAVLTVLAVGSDPNLARLLLAVGLSEADNTKVAITVDLAWSASMLSNEGVPVSFPPMSAAFGSPTMTISLSPSYAPTVYGLDSVRTCSGSSPPPSISAVSPSPVIAAVGAQSMFVEGGAFQNGAGLRVHLSNGLFQTDVTSTLLSATQLAINADVGATTANWTAQIFNPDGQSSNVFPFVVAVPQTTSFALPQLPFGGGWYTALYFANTTNTPAHLQVSFYGDDGSPLQVPLVGIGTVNSRAIDLNPHSSVMLETSSSGGPLQQGWADVALPTGVTGYAVFRQTVAGRADQEAVVQLTPESSQTVDLTYDDTALTTAVAFVNPTGQPLTVTLNSFDESGAPNGTTQVVLGARSKRATVLSDLPGLAGMLDSRGRVVFFVPIGAVSVLGLLFGGSAFTSIPVMHRPSTPLTQTIPFALPQFVFGDSWYTAMYFSNPTNSLVNVLVSFTADDGRPLSPPVRGIPIPSVQTVTLAPGATAMLESHLADNSGEGWAEAIVPPGVIGYAVFRQRVSGRFDQEASVPLVLESEQTGDLVYDDVLFTTSVAFLNPSDQQNTVTITAYSTNGALIGSSVVPLAPHSKVASVLKNLPGLSAMSGNGGWANFSVSNGDVSVLGLRFGAQAFTSIPVSHR